MLNILLYLQEKLYPDIQIKIVLKIYARTLIDYEVFDIINEILYQ